MEVSGGFAPKIQDQQLGVKYQTGDLFVLELPQTSNTAYSAFYQQNAAYQVPVGYQLRIVELNFYPYGGTTIATMTPGYADNNAGTNNTSFSPTNNVPNSALIVMPQEATNTKRGYPRNWVIPAEKYPYVQVSVSGGAAGGVFGYAVCRLEAV